MVGREGESERKRKDEKEKHNFHPFSPPFLSLILFFCLLSFSLSVSRSLIQVTDLKKCDFRPINEHLMREREAKKARSKEEKEKEKADKAKIRAEFGVSSLSLSLSLVVFLSLSRSVFLSFSPSVCLSLESFFSLYLSLRPFSLSCSLLHMFLPISFSQIPSSFAAAHFPLPFLQICHRSDFFFLLLFLSLTCLSLLPLSRTRYGWQGSRWWTDIRRRLATSWWNRRDCFWGEAIIPKRDC